MDVKKVLILVFVLAYMFSPDPVPGPIDDLIIAIVGAVIAGKTGRLTE